MRSWRPTDVQSLFRHPIFELERHQLAAGEERREALVLTAPHWINVVPLLADGRVLLIRQWRFGIQAPTLEIPGGMVDPGEDPERAARRELEEETGYRARKIRRLGVTHPNPAFLSNELSTWLASDLEAPPAGREVYGVEGEEIRVETVALTAIPGLIASGEITHSLVVAAFYLLGLGAADGPSRGPHTEPR
ncbi:MAG: NUDIX hydrolase [Acidobacteriota bacterium]|nr:NUDIX hydrolase [Acidobacteriota bacterium]MDH3522093.1 NUDIX hydrolase [Acidobacteriota bacterium]